MSSKNEIKMMKKRYKCSKCKTIESHSLTSNKTSCSKCGTPLIEITEKEKKQKKSFNGPVRINWKSLNGCLLDSKSKEPIIKEIIEVFPTLVSPINIILYNLLYVIGNSSSIPETENNSLLIFVSILI